MDDVPLCPDWWPRTLWQLHHPITLGGVHLPGIGPINMPPELNQLLLSLQVHTSSYHLTDKHAARELRKVALAGIQAAVQALGRAE